MRIEDLKRWHWALIGAFVGLVLGYVFSNLEPTDPGRSLSMVDFQRAARQVSRNPATEGMPTLRKIVVYPPEQGAYGKPVHRVHFEQLHFAAGDPTKWEYRASHLKAEVPFVRDNDNPNNTVIDFLEAAKKDNDKLSYRLAWERQGAAMYGMFVGGGVLLIGGVWPTVINLLVGAGLGKRGEKKPDYDLNKFGKLSADEEAAMLGATTSGKAVTQADQDKLKSMVDDLERAIGPGGATDRESTATDTSHDQPIRKLDGKPLESAAVPSGASDESKDYKGEYYPVARPTHKKD
ncbi:MAG TPA: hypothetical protein PKB10_06035 [Tepidisphaeraceae bacterium]|nr:hypothetical protein [Tepidisphaeraceae bacterium]